MNRLKLRLKRIRRPALRQWARDNPIRVMASCAFVLLVMQALIREEAYESISIAMIFLVFAFKSWVNLVFSVTTHKQHGETELSIATERYFWALLGQSVTFSLLFFVAFLDSMGVQWFGRDLIFVRNTLRSIGIISVMSVIIYGDQTLEALRDSILKGSHETKSARDQRQDRREVRQDGREIKLDRREGFADARATQQDKRAVFQDEQADLREI